MREGYRRFWRYQRVLWFIFFISLVFGHFSASPVIHKLDSSTDHSLASQRISEMFDYGTFSSLSSNPEVKLFEVAGVSFGFSLVFFVGMLFLTGGILEAYRADRKLTTREFFEACGSYFWRFVRLLILMLILFIPLAIIFWTIQSQAGKLMLIVAQEKNGFWLSLIGIVFVGFLMMCLRLWFDMAQVRAVVEEEYGMWSNAGRAFKLTFSNFGPLFWIYVRISVLGWLVFGLGIWIWTKMPPAKFWSTFLVLEVVILVGFAVRLWQRSSEMVWYQRRFLIPAIVAPATPAPPESDPLLNIAPAIPPAPQT